MRQILIASIIIIFLKPVQAQILDHSWKQVVFSKDSAWFGTDEARDVAENVLTYQRDIGGWPKNIKMQKPLSDDEKKKLIQLRKFL